MYQLRTLRILRSGGHRQARARDVLPETHTVRLQQSGAPAGLASRRVWTVLSSLDVG